LITSLDVAEYPAIPFETGNLKVKSCLLPADLCEPQTQFGAGEEHLGFNFRTD